MVTCKYPEVSPLTGDRKTDEERTRKGDDLTHPELPTLVRARATTAGRSRPQDRRTVTRGSVKYCRCLRTPTETRKHKACFTHITYFLTVKVARRPLFIGLLLIKRLVALAREGKPRTYVLKTVSEAFLIYLEGRPLYFIRIQ